MASAFVSGLETYIYCYMHSCVGWVASRIKQKIKMKKTEHDHTCVKSFLAYYWTVSFAFTFCSWFFLVYSDFLKTSVNLTSYLWNGDCFNVIHRKYKTTGKKRKEFEVSLTFLSVPNADKIKAAKNISAPSCFVVFAWFSRGKKKKKELFVLVFLRMVNPYKTENGNMCQHVSTI